MALPEGAGQERNMGELVPPVTSSPLNTRSFFYPLVPFSYRGEGLMQVYLPL